MAAKPIDDAGRTALTETGWETVEVRVPNRFDLISKYVLLIFFGIMWYFEP